MQTEVTVQPSDPGKEGGGRWDVAHFLTSGLMYCTHLCHSQVLRVTVPSLLNRHSEMLLYCQRRKQRGQHSVWISLIPWLVDCRWRLFHNKSQKQSSRSSYQTVFCTWWRHTCAMSLYSLGHCLRKLKHLLIFHQGYNHTRLYLVLMFYFTILPVLKKCAKVSYYLKE